MSQSCALLCNPPKYPSPIQKCQTRCKKPTQAPRIPLHKIMAACNIDLTNVETIKAVRQSPSWQPQLNMHIPKNPLEAIEKEDNDSALIKVYSDSSGIEGKIGAAAVLFCYCNGKHTKRTLCYCLGSETKHTVYEGELVGKILAQELLLQQTGGLGLVSLYIDSEAAVQASEINKPAPGHYLVDRFHQGIFCTKKKHCQANITLCWIPSHMEIEGNEEADRQAKKSSGRQH
jgi:ribonuclease HI